MGLTPRRSRQLASLFGLGVLLLALLIQFGNLPLVNTLYQQLERHTYDQRLSYHLAKDQPVDPRIVIVDIDEASLLREGRWPWSRTRVAELLARLQASGAILVGFDILFAEPERNPMVTVMDALGEEGIDLPPKWQQLTSQLDADATLARQLAAGDVVLGYTFNPHQPHRSGELPAALPLGSDNPWALQALPAMAGYSAPLPLLTTHSTGAGFFSLQPDPDGIVRRAPLLAKYQEQLYPSLSLEMLRRLFFLEQVELQAGLIDGKPELESITLDSSLTIPTDSHGNMLIPFRGPTGSFPYLPAHQLLSGEFDPELLLGNIVLVGTTAPGLFDLRATPVGEIYPGVEVHANLIAAMLDQQFLHEPSWARGANFALALFIGLLLALLLPWLRPAWLLLSSATASTLVVVLSGWFWVEHGLILALAGPLLVVALLTVFNLTWGYFFESLTRHHLKEMFGQYVPPELVDEMSESPGSFGFEGESRELSVLFADVRSFTTISESLEANELKRLLNHYFTPMTRLIFEHRGTIDKYVGDMIMAFWGAPVSNEQHAAAAIDTALAMLAETERLKPEFAARGWPEVNIGVGINSGLMNVGDMGSQYRRSYTVLGDAVNLASRLEGTTKYYGVGLVIGERTRELAGDAFVYRELDRVQVKGKHQAITVYQPICRGDEATTTLLDELDQYHRALALYRAQAWEQADALFQALAEKAPQTHIYTLYRERIAECRLQNLGADWDGVFVRDSK